MEALVAICIGLTFGSVMALGMLIVEHTPIDSLLDRWYDKLHGRDK